MGDMEVVSGHTAWHWDPVLWLLRSCLATGAGTVPRGPGNSRQSLGAELCHVSPHQQPPWKGLCSLLPFRVLHDVG